MREVVIKWCIRKLVFALDHDDTLIAYSFGKDERTDYHVIVERFYEDVHTFGTRQESYKQ